MLAVLFDLDQTLTDRPASMRAMAHRWLIEFGDELGQGTTLDCVYDAMMIADDRGYRPRAEFVAELTKTLPWRTSPTCESMQHFWSENMPRSTVARTGANQVVRELHRRGLKVGVVTNGSSASQNTKIDKLELRPFLGCVVVSESVGVKKPDRRIYETALDCLNARPQDTAFVGDHPVFDVLVPREMGMKAIWVSGVFDWPVGHPPPEHSVEDLNKLLPLL